MNEDNCTDINEISELDKLKNIDISIYFADLMSDFLDK